MARHYWDAEILGALTNALERARAGTPTVLLVEGEPGFGKSSLLNELVGRAEGFAVEQAEETSEPHGVLARWGAYVAAADDPQPDAALAAQRLRARVDELASSGRPVLLVLDDLQWADPESVTAILALVARASGDRLLLAVAARPLAPATHPSWQRWVARPERATRIELRGLAVGAAGELVREVRPGADPATVEALWRHTEGNPLYLHALAREYAPVELARMPVLPAPSAYARSVVALLSELDEPTNRVAASLAVLGPGWVAEPALAALAAIPDVVPAVQELTAVGLVETRPVDVGEIRYAHALQRSAIYQATPVDERRRLHLEAAVLDGSRALEHRVAAADRYDDGLAADLDAAAAARHELNAYRQAAQLRHTAATLTRDPVARERRRLDAWYETVLSGDRTSVASELAAQPESADRARRAVVEGILAIWQRRPDEGIAALEPVAGSTGPPDPATRYRVEVLLLWARMMTGGDPAEIRSGLERLAGLPPDPALQGFARLTAGLLLSRAGSLPDVLSTLSDLPARAAAVPPAETQMLAWRGSLLVGAGRFDQGAVDLTELVDRMQRGMVGFNAGSMHALLGRAQWFLGHWARARMNFRLAIELSAAYPHPLVEACVPLAGVGTGESVTGSEQLSRARELIGRTPWVEAVELLDVTEVVHAHVPGGDLAGVFARLSPAIREVQSGYRRNAVWLLHAALAATAAGQPDAAAACVDALARTEAPPDWAASAVRWLLGLVAEARGQGRTALAELGAAVASPLAGLPLYRAHVLADHARLAALVGDPDTAARSLSEAETRYAALAAESYRAHVEHLRQTEAIPRTAPILGLSDRERDVVTLVTAGLSYAQIARDLFITQSTVSYHLGNIYAKMNVKSRHQLTALVRREPAKFGLH